MLRSLFSGISGLRAHQTMMDVTGNNIANVNTSGYKTAQTQFQDTLSQMLEPAGAPRGARGGTNPAQVGLGVRVSGITTNFGQGSTQITGRSQDLMINGDGFFVTEFAGEPMYTRAGSMSFDAQGRMVTSDGAPLMGWMADATGRVDQAGALSQIRLPQGGLARPSATTMVEVGGNLPDDSAIGTSFTTPVQVFDGAGVASTVTATYTVSTAAVAATPATPGPPPVAATPATAAIWDVSIDGGPVQPLTFTLDGATPSPAEMTFAGVIGTAPNQTPVKLNMSAVTGYKGASTIGVDAQDGYATVRLKSFTIGPDGVLTGIFSNGPKQSLGQLAIGTFPNNSGLEKAGGSMYRTTANSGAVQIGAPGQNGRATLTGGALEMSNVDLAQEFTNLIIAQRGFQANSRIITSSDEILQDLVNLKR